MQKPKWYLTFSASAAEMTGSTQTRSRTRHKSLGEPVPWKAGTPVVCPAGGYVEDTCRRAGFSWCHAGSAVTRST